MTMYAFLSLTAHNFLLFIFAGINTSVTVRKPQAIPPSGMPADAKQNYVVPGVVNNVVKGSIMTAGVAATTTMATDARDKVWAYDLVYRVRVHICLLYMHIFYLQKNDGTIEMINKHNITKGTHHSIE